MGVWGVTTKECHDLKLPPYHAPKLDEPANPAHGVVDFNGYEKDKDRKKKSGLLVEKAIARKRVFPPVEAPATPSAPAAAPSTGT